MTEQRPKPNISNAGRRITSDWAREFPELRIYRARWLLRRAGPLVVGILLERDSGGEVYFPEFHVHFLGWAWADSKPTLTLITQLRSDRSGGRDGIKVRWHAEAYREAAERMSRQAPLALEGNLRLEDVLAAYRNYLATPMGNLLKPTLYRDVILLLAWARRRDDARSALSEATNVLDDDEDAYRHLSGREPFITHCRKAIDDPAMIDRTVEESIESMGLGDLPVSEMLV